MTAGPNDTVRILAIHGLDQSPPRALSHLVEGLRAQGATIDMVAIPQTSVWGTGAQAPSLAELKAGLHSIAESVGSALLGEAPAASSGPSELERTLGLIAGSVDAVVSTDARLAGAIFPEVANRWPEALRIAVASDFHIDPQWQSVTFDALVSPHPTLGAELGPIREGRARLYAGGPIVTTDGGARRLGTDKPNVVMSFGRVDPSEIDPLLFQLSLTNPDRYHLLFLPCGRPSVDDLVRSRAGGYGLAGKRPKAGSDTEPWIRGADLLVGHPTPAESAVAVASQVPQVLCTTDGKELSGGDAFLVLHGLALHAASALTVAVQVDQALPGGPGRGDLADAATRVETDGPAGAAGCVLRAIRDGRATPITTTATQDTDDELEEIGQPPVHHDTGAMDDRAREAYLRELILQQRDLKRQIDRARAGVDTWNHRLRLAQRAGNERLEGEAHMRVESIQRVLERLVRQEIDAQALRERFASGETLSAAERAAAAQILNPQAAATVDRLSRAAQKGAFERLEIEDALNELKRRMGRDD